MKRPDGITLISVYHFLVAGLSALGFLGLLMIPLLLGVSASLYGPRDLGIPIATTWVTVIFIGLVLLFIGGLNLVVGIGLWNLAPWARIAAIVLAALRLLNFPWGTAIGGLTIWYLLKPEVEALFVG